MVRILAWIFSFIGVGLSLFSLYEHVLTTAGIDSGSAACNISQTINCKNVILSDWSTFLGVPLGAWGLSGYVLILISLAWHQYRKGETDILALAYVYTALTIPASLFLYYVSKVIIGTLCPVCLLLYITNGVLFVLFFIIVRKETHSQVALFKKGLGFIPKAPLLFLVCAIVTFVSPAAIESMVNVEVTKRQILESRNAKMKEAFESWERGEVVEIQTDTKPGHLQDYRMGSANAPIQVVEFFDFECPACRLFYSELKELAEEYGDKVAVTYRNYPLDNNCNPAIKNTFHQYACIAAVFSRCAGEQGRYHEALDFLMNLEALDSPESANVEEALVAGIAELSLDAQAMKECRESERQLKKVQSDIRIADGLGLQSTPSVWVNGKKVTSLHRDVLKRIFESLL